MEFIREKIKEKPISKRKLAMKVGVAALCGLVFAFVVCIILAIAVPLILKPEENEMISTQDDTEQEDATQETEQQGNSIILPPDFNLSLDDYQTLQDELYRIGNHVNKSIVMVTKMENEADWTTNNFETEGQGSGVIISEDNNYIYILTERKIIADAAHIRISFVDGTGAEATMFKYDANTGIAILTVEKRQLKLETKRAITVAKMSSTSTVNNGALVIALGSPLGTNYSILTGNITSVENEVMTKDKNYSVYTTDIVASKNGSGVLINTNGEVIGMVIQAFSGSQDVSTLTAVAIDEINGIISNLRNGKDIPYVGLYISTVTDDISEDYDIPKGVFIKEVVADSPAMKAGLQNGDVITHINGDAMLTDAMFSEKIAQLIPGTTCEISVKRQNGNEYYDVTCVVTIGVLQE
ncbi:MAG: serine protease [Agathobacter sp.]|nr:serine protease [Agathobacter sp.]